MRMHSTTSRQRIYTKCLRVRTKGIRYNNQSRIDFKPIQFTEEMLANLQESVNHQITQNLDVMTHK